METFRSVMTARRKSLSLTTVSIREIVCADLGAEIHLATIRNWMAGRTRPDGRGFVALLNALQVPASERAQIALLCMTRPR